MTCASNATPVNRTPTRAKRRMRWSRIITIPPLGLQLAISAAGYTNCRLFEEPLDVRVEDSFPLLLGDVEVVDKLDSPLAALWHEWIVGAVADMAHIDRLHGAIPHRLMEVHAVEV